MPSDFSFLKKLSFQKLRAVHLEKKTFKSDDEPLQLFFYHNALGEQEQALNFTEVALLNDNVVGYITVCADRIKMNEEEINKIFAGNPPIYRSFGATLIGRLDADIDNRGIGICKLLVGRQLLQTAENNLKSIASARFLTVDSYDKSVGFYRGLGFQLSSQKSRRREFPSQNSVKLYIDIQDKHSAIYKFMEEYTEKLKSD